MKIKSFLLLLSAASVMFFASCKKEDNSQKFSPLSVEENKASIEENGIAMLNEVKLMEQGPTIDAATNMLDYMMLGSVFGNNPNMSSPAKVSQFNEFLKPIRIAKSLKNFNAKRVANDLKVNLSSETITQIWDNAKGTYTWVPADSTWNFTEGDEIRIEFPSTFSGTTNNAVFRVYGFEVEAGPFTWWSDYTNGSEYTGDLPKQIKSELKINQDVILSYALNITYENADKKPNSFITSLELPPFKFTFDANNKNDVSGAVSFNWTKSSKTLLLLSLSAKGDWSYENLNAEIGTDYVTSGNAIFQLMNIKVVGNVDLATINTKMSALDESSELHDSLYVAAQCDIINKYSDLAVCYVDNNLIIAKLIAFPSVYYETVYNPNTQQDEEIAYYEMGQRFVFKDNSTIDIKTYFQEGFDTLVTDIEDYIAELNDKYFTR